jgi:hypothetical protein
VAFVQIMVKKTRPEKPEKPLPPGTIGGGQKEPDVGSKFNPYMVKEVPDRPTPTNTNLHDAKAAPRDKPKMSR